MKVNDPTPKAFLDHLEDLRWVLIKSAAVFFVCFAASLAATKPLLQLLYVPLRLAGQDPSTLLRVLGVADPLAIQIELGLSGGLFVALPFLLFFVSQFLLPALTEKEARVLLPACIGGALLFFSGVAFCFYLIVPQTLRFFIGYNHYLGLETAWTIQNYVDFVLQILLAFGVSFELPLVLVVLNAVGIVRRETLAKYRRHVLFLIAVLTMCIMPTTDPISLGMMAIPLYALFELTLALLRILEKRRGDGRRGGDGDESAWPTSPQ